MKNKTIFTTYKLGDITLKNRVVMAPMTRNRATADNIPNDLMKEYYWQRCSAGLIISEGTSPSLNGVGCARIPGIYTKDQIMAWRQITEKVHKGGSKIFLQLMHTGRIANHLNMFNGGEILAPSAITAKSNILTHTDGIQPCEKPKAMSIAQIEIAKQEFVQGAKNAFAAGFDGVELQAANGYLLEQFISPNSNIRTDDYGGSIQNRCRFVLEVAEAVSSIAGKERTGIRLSPYGIINDIGVYPETDETYTYLADQLQRLNLLYVHLADQSNMGMPRAPMEIKRKIRNKFLNTLILAGGYGFERAEKDLNEAVGNLIAFGRPFIANPDLVERFKKSLPINTKLDKTNYYTAGRRGYTDYPNSHVMP